jgi:hypothetical protein
MSRLMVVNNHLGFRNGHGAKRVLVPDVPEACSFAGAPLFRVFEQNQFSMHGLNSPRRPAYLHEAGMARVETDFGRWLVGDLSHVTRTGIYQAYCGNEPGVVFAVRDDVWVRILPELVRYFQIQSCGREAPGWHPACHLDDGYLPEEDRYLRAAGGWHDAGDFRKWVTSTALNAIALLVGHRLWHGREERLGLPPGIFAAEAAQGAEYFLGVQDPTTGRLTHNVGGGARTVHDNEDNRYTDNIPESGDERRIHPGAATPQAKCTLLLALYATVLRDHDAELAARCLAGARLSDRADRSAEERTADALQWRAWARLELYRAEGRDEDRHAALAALSALLDLQVTEYVGGQQETRGFWRAEPQGEAFHHKHIGAAYPIWVLAEFLQTFPGHAAAGRWRDAIALWADEYLLYFAARNPFGLIPYALYTEPPADRGPWRYRRLGERLWFRYFLARRHFGTNARCGLAAAACAAAAGALGRPDLLDAGYRLLEWVIGNNPFQISTLTGVGVRQPCALSFQMGNIPGGVTMGVGGDEDDQPWYPHPWACQDEYYGYQSSQFLWGLLALQDVPYPAVDEAAPVAAAP